MTKDYAFVNVEITDSPDFRRHPFHLVSEGTYLHFFKLNTEFTYTKIVSQKYNLEFMKCNDVQGTQLSNITYARDGLKISTVENENIKLFRKTNFV